MCIIGFADDAFDLDIIKKELYDQINDNLREDNENENESIENESNENVNKEKVPSSVPLAKHYLVFIFTS